MHRIRNVMLAFFVIGFGGAHAQDRHLRLIEHATTDTTAHVGAKPDNSGDILTFHNEIFDAADKHRVGSDNGYCVRIEVGKSFECIWTVLLREGQITVEGPFYDDADSVLAVTGGTGVYVGAKGEMRLHARDAKGSAFDFDYELVK
jgi:allene oxide cyclase